MKTKNQRRYNDRQIKQRKILDQKIASSYDKMRRLNLDKGFIVKTLSMQFNCSRQRIYNAVDLRQYRHTGSAGVQPVKVEQNNVQHGRG